MNVVPANHVVKVTRRGVEVDGDLYDRITFNQDSRFGWVSVYGWGTYPKSSVLAGQPMKVFLESYDSIDAALAVFPMATPSSKWTEPRVSLSHLPGENDFVPGGALPDDWD